MPCFVIFWLLLRSLSCSPSASFPTMLSLVAVVAAFMAAERVQAAFMAEVSAVVLFMLAASMAGIASPEVRALLIR